MTQPDPVLGWRIWRVREGVLTSWAVPFTWVPGENHAVCLDDRRRRCEQAPGLGCQCGFWALWSPLQALAKAREDQSETASVLGLVRGWGTIAVHGLEGFRAERAAVACLFTDWPWADEIAAAEVHRGHLRSIVARFLTGPVVRPDPRLSGWLHDAAGQYGVPLLSFESALRFGFLAELSVPERALEQIRRRLQATAPFRSARR